jgi:hypothetical protein
MSALDEPSTINHWIAQQGPIHLRTAPRKYHNDIQAAHGIVTSIVISGAVLIWAYVIARMLMWAFW